MTEQNVVNLIQIKEKIDAFVKKADEVVKVYWERSKYTFAPPPTHEVEYGEKWARIVTVESRGTNIPGKSAHSFIALQDFSTKNLGHIKAGDIHKPAGWKVPAKHARGNIFKNFDDCFSSCGSIVYLK